MPSAHKTSLRLKKPPLSDLNMSKNSCEPLESSCVAGGVITLHVSSRVLLEKFLGSQPAAAARGKALLNAVQAQR